MSQLICYCYRVEKNTLVEAIKSGCSSVEALGNRFGAGRGCGGCRWDLEHLLEFHGASAAPSGAAVDLSVKATELLPTAPTAATSKNSTGASAPSAASGSTPEIKKRENRGGPKGNAPNEST